jgi:hypothetical protein
VPLTINTVPIRKEFTLAWKKPVSSSANSP